MKIHFNQNAKNYFESRRSADNVLAFHRRLPDYKTSPLLVLPHLASRFGVGEISLKAETNRFGLPAFKILGASWAVWQVLREKFALRETWQTIYELKELVKPHLPLKFVSATDGNHGRGVARMANWLGIDCRIFLPAGTAQNRIAAITAEGAEATTIDGSYDDAVTAAEGCQNDRALLIQDTSRPGNETVNHWIIEGYSTIFRELEEAGGKPPDVVFAQIGVGSLAAAVVDYNKAKPESSVKIIGVEPLSAACALQAVEKGEIIHLPGRQESAMSGLNCGTVSSAAWETLYQGVDCFLAVEDEWSGAAMRELATSGISTTESGAAGLAGLMALNAEAQREEFRQRLGLNNHSRILLLITEGITTIPACRREEEIADEPNYNF